MYSVTNDDCVKWVNNKMSVSAQIMSLLRCQPTRVLREPTNEELMALQHELDIQAFEPEKDSNAQASYLEIDDL